jgi:hypothetical protein
MTDYRFHSWPPSSTGPHAAFAAPSVHHGAALALRQFVTQGCDLGAPGAHLDFTDAEGNIHTLLVDEVVAWLREPQQAGFVERERLASLLSGCR